VCVCVCVCVCVWACVFVALVIQHAMPMRHTAIYVLCLSTQYFPTLSDKQHDRREKFAEHKVCVFISSTNSVLDISYSKKNWARYYHECQVVLMYSTAVIIVRF